jgi:hypothetical protein
VRYGRGHQVIGGRDDEQRPDELTLGRHPVRDGLLLRGADPALSQLGALDEGVRFHGPVGDPARPLLAPAVGQRAKQDGQMLHGASSRTNGIANRVLVPHDNH